METDRAEGIILRRVPVTESSLVVTWFTRERGKLKTLAKGGRRLKGPFAGKLDLFYRNEIVYLPSRRSDLHLLHDCYLVQAYRPLRESLLKVAQASYACELVDLATTVEDPQPRLFELLAAVLAALAERADDGPLLVWLELQVLGAAGWAPARQSGTAEGRLLGALGDASLAGVRRVRLRPEQLRQLRATLDSFWQQHVGPRPHPVDPAFSRPGSGSV